MQSFKSIAALIRPRLTFVNGRIGIRYIRGQSKFPRNFIFNHEEDESKDTVHNQLEELEDIMGHADPSDPFVQDEIQRIEKQKRQVLKEKIIKKKFFKKPKEVNLLTWAAKEQIRYLNEEYPDEWTVDRLAESFPTTREGIIKILKSSYRPRNESEILEHDKRVHKQWTAIKAGDSNQGGPMEPTLMYLMESKKTGLLLNAAGNQSLPMPSKDRNEARLLVAPQQLKNSKPGPFSKIIENYEKQTIAKKNPMKNDMSNIDSPIDSSEFVKNDKKLLESIVTDIAGSDMDIPEPNVNSKEASKFTNQSILSSSSYDVKETGSRNHLSRRERKLLKQQDHVGVNLSNVKTLQMLETKKMTQTNSQLQGDKEDIDEIKRRQKENSEFGPDYLSFDKGRSYDSSGKKHMYEFKYEERNFVKHDGEKVCQAYVYDDQHGYQHPVGVYDESLQNVDIPKRLKRPGNRYQKDNTVYDEDGEFLYRIP